MTLRPLKNWFENMSPRERFILLATAWAIVILWGVILLKKSKQLKTNYQTAVSTLNIQAKSLADRKSVEDQINSYAKIFQTSISTTELVNKIHSYAQAAGITQQLNISTNKRETGKKDDVFDINSATINFTHVDLRALVEFTQKIVAEKPYLMIGDMSLSPETLDPRLVDGNMRIDSLELKPHALDVSASGALPTAAP